MKKGETIITGWQDVLEELPVEPEGYSTAQQISDKIHITPGNVAKLLDKANVKCVWGRTASGRRVKYYKD